MEIEVTESKSSIDNDTQCDKQVKMKKKKTRKEEKINFDDTINGDDSIKYTDNGKNLKRSLSSSEIKTQKKRKKINDVTDLSINENDVNECHKDVKKVPDNNDKEMQTYDELRTVEDNDEDTDVDLEKVTETESNQLTGKYLRTCFTSADAIDMLRKFVTICKENKERDLAAEYLQAGGSVLEVLNILNNTEKKINITIVVFSAINILIIKVLSEYPQYQASTDEACRHLINSHLSSIHQMLSAQSSARQRRVILRMLAAMVSLGGDLPRELLTHLTLQPQAVETIVEHSRPTDPQNIRTCFIHFILAFLVDQNISVIRMLLDKRGLLSSIFPGMMYDSEQAVILILNTIKTNVLENPGINKTTKLHVFSTPVVQNLVSLYNWKGPRAWFKMKKKVVVADELKAEEKESVINVVHDFLTILLTSHQHGIIFHDRTLGTSRTKNNQLINTVLQSLERPWEHDKPADLVIKIMIACPDLIKPQLMYIEPFLEPRISDRWIILINFVKKIISSFDIETNLRLCSKELNTSQLTNAMTSLIMPQIIIKNVINKSIEHESILIRHKTVLLLNDMFKGIKSFLTIVQTKYHHDLDIKTVKHNVTDYILKNIPNVNIILKIWYQAYESEKDTQKEESINIPKIEHINNIIDLLQLYIDVCPQLLDNAFDVSLSTLFNTLDELNIEDEVALNTMKVKAIRFLFFLDSVEFSPNKSMFRKSLSFLMPLLSEQIPAILPEVVDTIKILLSTSGIFEGCADQLDIWINGFFNLDTFDDKTEVINWFLHTLKIAVKDIDKYIDIITKAEEMAGEQLICATRLEDIFIELVTDDGHNAVKNNNHIYMQSSTSIPPLLCCAIQKAKDNSNPVILCYLSYILIHTLHRQIAPGSLIYIAKEIEELPVQEYLVNWLENKRPAYVKKIFASKSIIDKLSKALLTNAKINLNEIFTGDDILSFENGTENLTINYSLTSYQTSILFQMTIFYITQFAQRNMLTEMQNENCKTAITCLLNIAKDISDKNNALFINECAKIIFTHPIFLQFYSPLSQNKNRVEKMITTTIFQVCKTLAHLCNGSVIKELVLGFKNKLLAQLQKMISKEEKTESNDHVELVVGFLELLQLNSEDVVQLLSALVKLKQETLISNDKSILSIYGNIIPKLLQLCCKRNTGFNNAALRALNHKFIERLLAYFVYLKTVDIMPLDNWEKSLYEYMSVFPYNIARITTTTFTILLTKRINQSTVNLFSFWISRSQKLLPAYIKYITESENINHSMIFPVIAKNLKFQWDQDFLQKLNKYYKNDILGYLTNPETPVFWIEENAAAIAYLIKQTFTLKSCKKACDKISQIGDKLETVSVHYLNILESVYNRYATLQSNCEAFIDLIHVLVHITTLTLKKKSNSVEKLMVSCELLEITINHLKAQNVSNIRTLSNSNSWSQFTRFSLKLGLKVSKDNSAQLLILKTLCKLCDIAYIDDEGAEYAKTLFEMTTSHSEFVNIMLSSSPIKRNLIELLWILVRKNKLVMASNHIPLYLAAYNATLSETDQLILLMLQYYESNAIRIDEYRPYLWGNAAAIHYSVRGNVETALWRQPSTTQVFNLFEKDVVNNTIASYPVHRSLMDKNVIESSDVYDPAFYLPLLCHLLSDNNIVACHKVTQSGALALAFSACSSIHCDVRLAAYTVIARYYFHVEASSSKERLLWMRLIDSLQNGIASLESSLKDVRLSCLISTFLARTSIIVTQPLHTLYLPLNKFLMAKPALNLGMIPELLQLFHGSDIDHKAHRHWILEGIRDGIKTQDDVQVAMRCVLFKMLLNFHNCSLCDNKTRRLIWEILYSTTKIPKAALILIRGYGLLPWMTEAAKKACEMEMIDLVVKITENLLNVLTSTKEHISYKHLLLNIMLIGKEYLIKSTNVNLLILYVGVLRKLFEDKIIKKIVQKQDIVDLVEYSETFLDNIEECKDMLCHGCNFVPKIIISCDSETDIARGNLRALVWAWCKGTR